MTKTKLFLVDVFLYSHNLSADNVLTLWGEILCLLGSSLLKLERNNGYRDDYVSSWQVLLLRRNQKLPEASTGDSFEGSNS